MTSPHPLRFLKSLLTNRFTWSILLILLELIFLGSCYLFFYDFFFPLTLFIGVLSVLAALYLINIYENIEMRFLWLVIITCLPIVGPFLFIILALNGRNKSLRRRAEALNHSAASFYPENPALDSLKTLDPSAYLQANYICHANHISLSTGNKLDYFPTGESLFQRLLPDLEAAKNFIFLEFFIIRPGQLWDRVHQILLDKVQSGVDVYLMYDDIGSIFTVPANFYKSLQSEGIHCIPSNKFNSRLSGFKNNRDHRKVVVIDGKVGYTGGINLADEYENSVVRFGYWKDSGLRIEGPAVTNLLTLFLCSWNLQIKSPTAPLDFEKYRSPIPTTFPKQPGYAAIFGSGPYPVYDTAIAKDVYLNLITSAKTRLYITTPYLICDSGIMNALALTAQKGVDVRIITPKIPDKKLAFFLTRSNYSWLIVRGVKIYEYTPGFIHAKNLICDDDYGVCGTVNLDFRSMIYHFECAAWMYKTPCLKSLSADFDKTFKSCRLVTAESARFSPFARFIAKILKVFTPLF